MPRISTFYGIVIATYYRDHAPPHFHAIYREHEATIGIGDLDVLSGFLPRRLRAAARVQRLIQPPDRSRAGALARAERGIMLDVWLAELPEREREILRARFEEDLTQSEIADRARDLADARLTGPAQVARRPARDRPPNMKGLERGRSRRRSGDASTRAS